MKTPYCSTDRRTARLLLAMAGCLLQANVALAQAKTKTVRGTLSNFTKSAVLIEIKDGERIVKVDNNTRVTTMAPATGELIAPGVLVEVSGTATSPTSIENAQVTIIVSGRAPVYTNGGTYYLQEAKSPEKIPVVLVGNVVKTEPLLVKGNNSIESRYRLPKGVNVGGVTSRVHTFPTINKVFEVKIKARRGGELDVWADLGNAVQLAGADAKVEASVDSATGIAQSINIQRDEPLTLEELGLGDKKAKGSSKKPTIKKTTSSPRPKKGDDDGDPKADKSKSTSNGGKKKGKEKGDE